MYVLAAWTGFRKGEIGSLTIRSLRSDDDPPTAIVAACYSKRRHQDTKVLHPELVRQLREWLQVRSPKRLRGRGAVQTDPDALLFPVSGRAGGVERKTSRMIERDLMVARKSGSRRLSRRNFSSGCNLTFVTLVFMPISTAFGIFL